MKLLLKNGASLNYQDDEGNDSLDFGAKNGYSKIVDLLKKYKKINENLKKLNKQLEKTQSDGQKTQVEKDLQATQKELEQLLKIELADIITKTELREISDNSSETILGSFIEKK